MNTLKFRDYYVCPAFDGDKHQNSDDMDEAIEESYDTHRPILLPPGRRDFARPIDIRYFPGVTIQGCGANLTPVGVLSEVRFDCDERWIDDDILGRIPTPGFRMHQNRDARLAHFTVRSRQPIGAAFLTTTTNDPDESGISPTSMAQLERVYVDGVNAGKIAVGFDIAENPHEKPSNDSEYLFWRSMFVNLSVAGEYADYYENAAGFRQAQSQAKHQSFEGCAFMGFPPESDNFVGMDVLHGALEVHHTAIGHARTCFRMHRNNSAFVADFIESEGARGFIDFAASAWTYWPITISNSRFSQDRCQDGDVLFNFTNQSHGPIKLSNITFDGGRADRKVIPVSWPLKGIGHGDAAGTASMEIDRCQFRTGLSSREVLDHMTAGEGERRLQIRNSTVRSADGDAERLAWLDDVYLGAPHVRR